MVEPHAFTTDLPNSVTTIGDGAFVWCYNLKKITLPDSVTEIGDSAFGHCYNLKKITLPDSVTEIGDGAFKYCYNLKKITIPNSLTEIGDNAFAGCKNLKEVFCKATTPPSISIGVFYNNASDCKIYVPRESVEAYKSAKGWKDYASAIVGYDFYYNNY